MSPAPFRSDSSDEAASREVADIVRGRLELNDDGLHFRIGLDALSSLFAPDTRLFVAAEGQCRINDGVAVAPYRASLDLGGQAVHGGQVLGPNTGAQAVAGVVGCLCDFVEVVEALRHHHRSKNFIA